MLIYEGDAFNRTLVERARRRLTALDFFEKIDFQEEEGSAPDKINLIVVVQEKSTGKISFSVGYSTYEQVIGSVELSERNFMGRGQYRETEHDLELQAAAGRLQLHRTLFHGHADFGRHRSFCHARSDNIEYVVL